MNYILKTIALQQNTIFLWFPVFIACAIHAFISKNFYYTTLLIPFMLHKNGYKIALAAIIGTLSAFLRLEYIDNNMLKTAIDFATLQGEVTSLEYMPNGIRFILKSEIGNIRINWKGNFDSMLVTPGSEIEVVAKIFPIKAKTSPIAFDFKRQAFFNNIAANAVVLRRPIRISSPLPMSMIVETERDVLNKKLFQKLDQDIAGVASALLTGNKAGITQEVRQAFAYSGIAHILAISGLHVSLVGGFIFMLIRLLLCCCPFVLRCNPKKIAATFAFLGSLLYISLANGAIPATRALIMQSIVTCAILMNKSAFSMRNVSLAASIILICAPEVIYSPGFYMSFFTVVALIGYYENWGISSKNYFTNIIKSSIVASSVVIPFSVYFFNNLTANSIPANLVAIPLTGIIIMPSLLCFAVGLETVPMFFINNSIKILIESAKYFSSWEYSYFLLPTPPVLSVQIISISILLIFMANRRILGLLGVLVSIMLYITNPMPMIFINKTADVFGISHAGKFYVTNLVRDRSTSTSWMRSLGIPKKIKLPMIKNQCSIGNISILIDSSNVVINNNIIIPKIEIEGHNGCMITEKNELVWTL